MPQYIYYILAAISIVLTIIGSTSIWLLKLVWKISGLVTELKTSISYLKEKTNKIEDHNIRLAVLETRVETMHEQNGKHEDYQ